MIHITDIEFNLLKDYLYRVSGIELSPKKKYLFQTRMGEFLKEKGFSNFSRFYQELRNEKNPVLQRQFVQAMTTHESSFFRDIHPFVLFDKKIRKMIIKRLEYSPDFKIRIFSAGCSKGQEPYSIAMCLKLILEERKYPQIAEKNFSILATDISHTIVSEARKGLYTDLEIGKTLSEDMKQKFFSPNGKNWEVRQEVKKLVQFTELNLAESFQFIGRFDIIFCRNVIIYFPVELKRKILKQFKNILAPDGFLIMGATEGIYQLSDDFQMVHEASSTFYIHKK